MGINPTTAPPPQPGMTGQQRAELLLNHYDETFQQILHHWKVRNRTFLFILIVMAGICVDLYQPNFFCDLGNAYLQKQFQASQSSGGGAASIPKVDFCVLGCMVWFLLLCLVIHYYQRSIHVDRQYKYLATIERKLDELVGPGVINREGQAYKSATGVAEGNDEDHRPLFLRTIGWLYTIIFPIFLIFLVFVKFCREFRDPNLSWVFLGISSLIGVALIVYDLLYLRWVLRRK